MSVELTTLDFLNGLFSLLVVLVSATIGILIFLKYFKYKHKLYLYWGLAIIGLYSPWWSSAVAFVVVILTGELISLQLYILLGSMLVLPLLILWILGLTEMVYQDKRKILLLIYCIVWGFTTSYIIYFSMVDPTQLGTKIGVFDIKFTRIILFHLLFANFTAAAGGIIVARDSLKSEDREIRFKGKCLIIAFIIFPIVGIIDGALEFDAIGLIIVRSLLMLSAVMCYIGFFVPKFIKKMLKFE